MRMNETEFLEKMARLTGSFGDKAFDRGRMDIIYRCVRELPPISLDRIIDHMISNFRQAPLPKDFKAAVIAEKNHFSDLRSVPEIMQTDFKGDGGLQRVMVRDYPGCKTLWDAVEVERIKLLIKNADGP